MTKQTRDRPIKYIAYQNKDNDMVPASQDGVLLVFPDTNEGYEAAVGIKGSFGIVAATWKTRLVEIAKRYGLQLPKGTG